MLKSKRGMFDQLVTVAVALVIFIIVLGIGLITVDKFTASQCNSGGYTHFNSSTNVCQNSSVDAGVGNTSTSADVATLGTMRGYLGTSSGGLGSWTVAIIALIIGVLFIGAIMTLRGRQY